MSSQTHTVQRGDTLYNIARRYADRSVSDLVALNADLLTQGVSTPLKVGWQLVISKEEEPPTHTVQKGDTLYSIARLHPDISVSDVVTANPNLFTQGKNTPLEIGWVLRIAKTPATSPPAPPTSPSPAPVATPRSRTRTPHQKVMDRVRQYDAYIQEASQKYGISVEKIRAIIAVESLGRADANNGFAFGLMQLTPTTWGDTQRRFTELQPYEFKPEHWQNPHLNILFGTATLVLKMRSVGIGLDDPRLAEIAVIAYNAGQGTVRRAMRNAQAGGSSNPSADFTKPEYLKPAIEEVKIYKFYLTGQGRRRNVYLNGEQSYHPDLALRAAIDLKYQEISAYPRKVQQYLAVQEG